MHSLVSEAYLPAAHDTHAAVEAPPATILPESHFTQLVEPALGWCDPTGQAEQEEAPERLW